MKFAHNVSVKVFCKPEDKPAEIKKALVSLFPFDLEKEKIAVEEQSATGFNERKIKVFEIKLKKDSHMNAFLKSLKKYLGGLCETISNEAGTRVDDEFYFFIRLDKGKLIEGNEYNLTDSGNCFHIRISLAVFPKKRDIAISLVREFFSSSQC